MPPWPADRSYSSLLDEMYLTEEQINNYLLWVDIGAPQGNPTEEHTMPNFPEGSSIGTPDLVIQMDEPYNISGDYSCIGPIDRSYFIGCVVHNIYSNSGLRDQT